MPAEQNHHPTPPLPVAHYARRVWAVFWRGLLALLVLLALLWAIFLFYVLPRLPHWQPEIEDWASAQLGLPVRMEHLSVSGRWRPTFHLQGVRVNDAHGRAVLTLPVVKASLGPSALWRRQLSNLRIERPQLHIERRRDGHILVGGIDVSAPDDGQDGTAALDWLLSLPRFELTNGRVLWQDALRATPPLTLQQVDVSLRNGWRRHRLQVQATPPSHWGQRLSLQADMRGANWRQWHGRVILDLPQLKAAPLGQYLGGQVHLAEATGRFQAQGQWQRGRWHSVQVQSHISAAKLRLQPDLPYLHVRDLQGNWTWQAQGPKDAQGQRGPLLQVEDLQFATADGLHWPASRIQLQLQPAQAEAAAGSWPTWQGGQVQGDHLDLALLAALAKPLPMAAPLRQHLHSLQPQGQLRDWSFAWQGDLAEPQHYSASGQVQGLALQPAAVDADQPDAPQRPGLGGADVRFALSEAGGQAQLDMQQAWLDFPGVFAPQRVAIDKLAGQVLWQRNAAGDIRLQVPQLRFANADAQGSAKAEWRSTPGTQGAERFPGWMRLEGQLDRGEGTAVWRYLPLQIGDEARDYVRHAIQAGEGRKGRFHIEGDLQDIPSADPKKGRFYIAAQISGARYDFAPAAVLPAGSKPWPVLEDLRGELIFDGMGMQVRGAQGRSGQLKVLQADAEVADWDDLQVKVKGDLQGDLGSALGVLRSSAIGDLLSGALQQAEGSGPSQIALQLHLPIDALEQAKVAGEVTLKNNRLRLHPHMPWLSQAEGRVSFSENGFVLRQTRAQGLGGQIQVKGGMGPLAGFAIHDEDVHIQAQGQLQAQALRDQKQLPELALLGQKLQGSTPYRLKLDFVGDFIDFDFDSDLQGLALQLPPPFNKEAAGAWPTRVQLSHGGTGLRTQQQLQAQMGSALRLHYVWPSTATAKAMRGRLALGQAAQQALQALPPYGVQASVKLAQLPAQDWLALRELWPSPSAAPAAAQPNTTAAALPDWAAFLPTTTQWQIGQLAWGSGQLQQVQARLSQQAGEWRLQGRSQEASGSLAYLPANTQYPAGKLTARIDRIDWSPDKRTALQSNLERSLQAPNKPQTALQLPALDIEVQSLSYQGQALGRVAIEAENMAQKKDQLGPWRLHKLHIDTPESSFKGQGSWQPDSAQGQTQLQFDWQIQDAGSLLERLGQKGVLAKGRGEIKGEIAWPGPVSQPDPNHMTGQLQLNVRQGRLLKADPGAAKLLGVLNLQALPRRLSLDFRDVFARGFAFDFVRGDVQIRNGQASTHNLQMQGVNAAVLMDGMANLNNETQDVRVLILPEINAGTAALIATAINPAVGLGSFVAQWLLSKPVNKIATQELRITGSWRDPKVEKVKQDPAATPPDQNTQTSEIQP